MGSDSESLMGKVKDGIGSVISGKESEKVSRADEDPDIDYPEPLDQEITEDGTFLRVRREDQGEQGDAADAAPGSGTEDTSGAGNPTEQADEPRG